MKRIGILGGTFNPIHIGHLAIAQVALEELHLDQVVFVPSNLPPHKSGKKVVAGRHRYKMVRLAIKGNVRFRVSDYEIKHKGKSYSVHTVTHFRNHFPKKTKFYFILGSDMLAGLPSWKRINDLRKLVTFIVINRKGSEDAKSPIRTKAIKTLDLGISSTYLRNRLRKRKTVKYLIPEDTLKYIHKQKLYMN